MAAANRIGTLQELSAQPTRTAPPTEVSLFYCSLEQLTAISNDYPCGVPPILYDPVKSNVLGILSQQRAHLSYQQLCPW